MENEHIHDHRKISYSKVSKHGPYDSKVRRCFV